jgi:8-oxo-dGTP pyrophosphatase MutT (NUDIX family)
VEQRYFLSARRSARLRNLSHAAIPAPDADWLRQRLAAPDGADAAVATPEQSAGAWSDDAALADHADLVPAAVLIPIIPGATGGILLTKRSEALRRHSGQVSFPGGRMDAADASAEHAALREAHEEVGLDPASVEVMGRLRNYVTGTGYRVTPVLGLLRPGYTTALSADEVAEIFVLPWSTVLDPRAPERRSAEYQGRLRQYWVWPHPRHYIWGATAAIMVHLAHRLRG